MRPRAAALALAVPSLALAAEPGGDPVVPVLVALAVVLVAFAYVTRR